MCEMVKLRKQETERESKIERDSGKIGTRNEHFNYKVLNAYLTILSTYT